MQKLWLGFSVSVLFVACASDDPRSFVGELEGTDSRIGVTIDDDIGKAYVCGGEVDRGRHHDWFDLARDNDGDFVGTEGDDTVSVTVDGDTFTGTVTIDGETFDTLGTRAQGVDGLFAPAPEDEEGACRLGVVVADGGDVVQGVFCPDEVSAVQVVPVDFNLLTAEGFTVQSDTASPVTFDVLPVTFD